MQCYIAEEVKKGGLPVKDPIKQVVQLTRHQARMCCRNQEQNLPQMKSVLMASNDKQLSATLSPPKTLATAHQDTRVALQFNYQAGKALKPQVQILTRQISLFFLLRQMYTIPFVVLLFLNSS